MQVYKPEQNTKPKKEAASKELDFSKLADKLVKIKGNEVDKSLKAFIKNSLTIILKFFYSMGEKDFFLRLPILELTSEGLGPPNASGAYSNPPSIFDSPTIKIQINPNFDREDFFGTLFHELCHHLITSKENLDFRDFSIAKKALFIDDVMKKPVTFFIEGMANVVGKYYLKKLFYEDSFKSLGLNPEIIEQHLERTYALEQASFLLLLISLNLKIEDVLNSYQKDSTFYFALKEKFCKKYQISSDDFFGLYYDPQAFISFLVERSIKIKDIEQNIKNIGLVESYLNFLLSHYKKMEKSLETYPKLDKTQREAELKNLYSELEKEANIDKLFYQKQENLSKIKKATTLIASLLEIQNFKEIDEIQVYLLKKLSKIEKKVIVPEFYTLDYPEEFKNSRMVFNPKEIKKIEEKLDLFFSNFYK